MLLRLTDWNSAIKVYTEMMEIKYSVLPKGMLKPRDGPVNKINGFIRNAIA